MSDPTPPVTPPVEPPSGPTCKNCGDPIQPSRVSGWLHADGYKSCGLDAVPAPAAPVDDPWEPTEGPGSGDDKYSPKPGTEVAATEFIEGGQRILPLSVAIVAEDGAEFYGVITDTDRSLASEWVVENVLPHLDGAPDHICDYCEGGAEFIGNAVREWVKLQCWTGFDFEKPEFWADYAAYDWVMLCQLFGTMMDLPDGWPMFVRDIQQIRNGEELPQPENAHNAMSDALNVRNRWLLLTRPSEGEQEGGTT